MLLGDIAHRCGTLWPSRTAFVWSGRRRTYGELARRVERLSSVFAAAGVRTGSRVALLSANTPEAIETAFAASRLGACVVPLNTRLAPAEIRFQIEDSGAAYAVVHPALEPLARESGLLALTHWMIGEETRPGVAAGAEGPRPGADTPIIQLYTSGTTGRPKGCLLTNRGWVAATVNAVQGLGVTGEDRLLATLPLFHVAGYGMVLAHLAMGGTVVFPAGAGPDEAWSLIAEHGVTVAIFPTGTRRALRHPSARPLRLVYGMAGTERAETLRILAELGCDYRGVYGSTEAGNFVAVSTLAEELERPGTVGRPLPAFDIAIEASPGEPGELLVRGPSMMAGYANLPGEGLRDGWLHTGDVMRRDDDGYLYFVDRAKDMIKTGGENVYSAEVERVLLTHPGVGDAAVFGVPDRRWGEAVKALVVTRAPVGPEELDAYCRDRLGAFKRPRWYEFAAAIPRNHSGKILKRDLREAHDPDVAVRLPESR
ncbi:AMP-binding protein [Actinomadura sp. DC4]|uniref:class I adenylate-forming enzyme family protein n=1 Tax=Actinomadura sp. DC4 TaxID=3055069 RepID=UPI0025B25EFE|nr:AMP-binding protein [Actinomadura sp. DC4]MDN3355864.1 AMP-binding protein [Actinomadura sp. DC4]